MWFINLNRYTSKPKTTDHENKNVVNSVVDHFVFVFSRLHQKASAHHSLGELTNIGW